VCHENKEQCDCKQKSKSKNKAKDIKILGGDESLPFGNYTTAAITIANQIKENH